MAELLPNDRRNLIVQYVTEADINWAHIAIACMMKADHIDRVYTTNFDNLLIRACAMLDIFPAVYDMTVQAPNIAIAHSGELNSLLKPIGLTRYNLKGLMRAEYTFINNSVMNRKGASNSIHVEYMRNRLYRSQLEFLQKSQMPASTLNKSHIE